MWGEVCCEMAAKKEKMMKLAAMVLAVLCAGGMAAWGLGQEGSAGFFRTRQVDGKWWLVDPKGELFISKGVTTVSFYQDRIQGTNVSPYGEANKAKYGTEDAWREATAKRLIGWGFNTLGAWSDEKLCQVDVGGKHLACAPTIDLGAAFVSRKMKGTQAWMAGVFPDVFDPEFEKVAREITQRRCAARKDDATILGWFTDNELRWGPDWRGKDELLTMFLALPAGTPGRVAAVERLKRRHGEIGKFNGVWKTSFASWDELMAGGDVKPPVVRKEVYAQNQAAEREANESDPMRAAFAGDCDEFVGMLAERYFRITAESVKAADPNHMVFGARFAYVPPQPVVAAAVKYLDVVSFNCYDRDPRKVIRAYSVFNKPLIIGEFSFRGADSGLPNTKGAGPVVATQNARATGFASYVRWGLSQPNLVGYHWFEHCDEPKEGRFDGENSNYGVVNIKDEVYTTLVEEMTQVNAKAEEMHRGEGQ